MAWQVAVPGWTVRTLTSGSPRPRGPAGTDEGLPPAHGLQPARSVKPSVTPPPWWVPFCEQEAGRSSRRVGSSMELKSGTTSPPISTPPALTHTHKHTQHVAAAQELLQGARMGDTPGGWTVVDGQQGLNAQRPGGPDCQPRWPRGVVGSIGAPSAAPVSAQPVRTQGGPPPGHSCTSVRRGPSNPRDRDLFVPPPPPSAGGLQERPPREAAVPARRRAGLVEARLPRHRGRGPRIGHVLAGGG